ncbi:MAG: response regulator transcription factor [Xanthobacteraceae bacterium]|nr:response regulator transcription factor [Xanthobacteraceae bacterium]MBV9628628.1 response regulator transcription factor [Xanthobacteraceae bacterium]
MAATAPTVHIVDDDAPFRTAVRRVLDASGYRVALYDSAEQLLAKLPAGEPGCILLDVRMPGLSGPQLQERLAELGNRVPIVFLTGHGDIPMSVQAIKAGAEDFLTKPVAREKLVAAVERALTRDAQQRAHDSELDGLRARVSRLTPRESEVFALVVRGKLNKQIAGELGTAERTVKAHRQKVMEKCEAQSLAELVRMAERLGMAAAPE